MSEPVTHPPCPDPERLRLLLLDEGSDGDEPAELTEHIGRCEACRVRLEQLAADDRDWRDLRDLTPPTDRDPGPGDPPADATDSHSLAPEASRLHGPDPEHPAWLAFLTPTDRADRIGQFGPYEVIEVVGRGGMGVVLKAFDPALHRVVAIKVLAPQLAAGATARKRFLREARAAASIADEHVVPIFAVDEQAGFPYLVMPYIAGKSLHERIGRDGPLEPKEILRIGMQAAAGLAAAHAQGLVHRDIKPANILLENGVERVKLTDFGLARAIDDPSLTQSGVVAGTPEYMAPEQARGEAVDARADLFSLGAVLYTMATGRSPFRAPSTMAVLRRVSDQDPRPIRESNPDIPGWLAAIINRLLAKHPADRPQTAAEVARLLGNHLAALQRGEQPASAAATATTPLETTALLVPARRVASRPRRLALAAAAGLLGLTLLGAGEAAGVTHLGPLLATVLRLRTAEGTLVLELDDPEAVVQIDGDDLVLSGGGVKELRLKAGPHQLRTVRHGQPGPIQLVEVSRNGRRTVRVGLEPDGNPPRIVAPAEGGQPPSDPAAVSARQPIAAPAPEASDPNVRPHRVEPARAGMATSAGTADRVRLEQVRGLREDSRRGAERCEADLAAVRKEREVAQQEGELRSEQAKRAETQFESGRIPGTDRDRAQVAVVEAAARVRELDARATALQTMVERHRAVERVADVGLRQLQGPNDASTAVADRQVLTGAARALIGLRTALARARVDEATAIQERTAAARGAAETEMELLELKFRVGRVSSNERDEGRLALAKAQRAEAAAAEARTRAHDELARAEADASVALKELARPTPDPNHGIQCSFQADRAFQRQLEASFPDLAVGRPAGLPPEPLPPDPAASGPDPAQAPASPLLRP